ncbi:uncharacterized protein LOC143296079 [Babylonia areolata]|uniref:uncharacterized protein LOC143296079 n=1 Tax=Babylonia areolata TaxID=304850 RepID=UPI003FD3FC19
MPSVWQAGGWFPGGWVTTGTRLTLACLTLGAVLFVVGFSTDWWVETVVWSSEHRHMVSLARGLWRHRECPPSGCTSHPYHLPSLPGFHRTAQGLECVGLAGLVLSYVLLLLFGCVKACHRRETVVFFLLFSLGAVMSMVAGFCVFTLRYVDEGFEMGWSLGVAIAGCSLTLVADVVIVAENPLVLVVENLIR